jgi:hypothetical protein
MIACTLLLTCALAGIASIMQQLFGQLFEHLRSQRGWTKDTWIRTGTAMPRMETTTQKAATLRMEISKVGALEEDEEAEGEVWPR